MKYPLFWTLCMACLPLHLWARSIVLTDSATNVDRGQWHLSNVELGFAGPAFRLTQTVLHGGRQEGSKVLTITSAQGLTIVVSPTRGMGILQVSGHGTRLGWDSPVDEVVNPATMTLESRQGLGWLEGFNEMLVRCGFAWSGHPVTDQGLLYTLHGRAQNTPASKVVVDIDDKPPHQIRLRGLIKEAVFKKSHFQVWTELQYIPGQTTWTIRDVLTNLGDYPQDYQIIYHSNFGPPILQKDARFVAAAKEVSPFNPYAQIGLATWQRYLGPTPGFDEMVFNIVPYADSSGKTEVALVNQAEDRGVAIQFNTNQLPFLTLWKNTDTLRQGYVTGLEPGTNFAYPVTVERAQGRIRQLLPGQQTEFVLTYTLLVNAAAVQQSLARVQTIQQARATAVIAKPIASE